MRALLASVVLLVCASSSWAVEDRIWLGAKVNGEPARLFLDTGAPGFYLFHRSAIRIGLEVPEMPAPVPWNMYYAGEKCFLECPGFKGKLRPVIVEAPGYLPLRGTDGFVGWKTIQKNLVRIDAERGSLSILTNLPPDLQSWTKLKVRTQKPSGWKRWGILALELPKPSREIIIIDTGSSFGAGLPKARWEEWKAAHSNRPLTLAASAMPSAGIIAREQSFADEYSLGPLRLADLLIEETEPWSQNMARSKHAATLGMAALARIELVVDGKAGIAYVRSNSKPGAIPNHNRLGAVFIPATEKSNDLVAKVLPRTPAAEAGIQNGDVLLNVDGRDMTRWRESLEASGGFGSFWERPAGTRPRLKLKRGDRTFEVEANLRDLLTNSSGADRVSESSP